MPRPRKLRSVHIPPHIAEFKPIGVRGCDLQTVELALDEYEAIRLADLEGLDHAQAADRMEISRSTFSRLVERARAKVARFIVLGQRLRIGGGDVHFVGNVYLCRGCGRRFSAELDTDLAVCPACGESDLQNLAGGFGHGNCCRRHHRRTKGEAMFGRHGSSHDHHHDHGNGHGHGHGDGHGSGNGAHGGGGRNGGGGFGAGGFCVCAGCGHKTPHEAGVKCTGLKCPECGRTMVREELLNQHRSSGGGK